MSQDQKTNMCTGLLRALIHCVQMEEKMTKEEMVRAAVKAAGEVLEEIFPDVEFHITAKGDNGHARQAEHTDEAPADKSAFFSNLIGIGRLMEAFEQKAPQGLRTAAAKVELYRNICGDLTAACAEPAEVRKELEADIREMPMRVSNAICEDALEDEVERALEKIFAKECGEETDGCSEECVCHHCEGCAGCDPEACEADDGDEDCTACVLPTCMVNVRFGEDLAGLQVDYVGNAKQTQIAAAMLWAALETMPDWPDEKWQDFLDLLEELAWMLGRADS